MIRKQYIFVAMFALLSAIPAFAQNSNDGLLGFVSTTQNDSGAAAVADSAPELVHYYLPRAYMFQVIRNNVPKSEQPNAVQSGGYVSIPELATISVLGSRQDPQYGEVLNVSLDTEPDSSIPSDFEISAEDLKSSGAQLVPEDVLAKIENADQTEDQAIAADLADQQAAVDGFYTMEASGRRRAYRSYGRGGRRHAGMTYCLANVEDRAKQMGVCPYRVYASPQGWARTSLPGFIRLCNMTRYTGTDYQNLPLGSICVSHGTFHHYCGGKPCGDAKIKVGARSWYGVGYSNHENIGPVIGCAVPAGSPIASHRAVSRKHRRR